jgi:hypothetical protein
MTGLSPVQQTIAVNRLVHFIRLVHVEIGEQESGMIRTPREP